MTSTLHHLCTQCVQWVWMPKGLVKFDWWRDNICWLHFHGVGLKTKMGCNISWIWFWYFFISLCYTGYLYTLWIGNMMINRAKFGPRYRAPKSWLCEDGLEVPGPVQNRVRKKPHGSHGQLSRPVTAKHDPRRATIWATGCWVQESVFWSQFVNLNCEGLAVWHFSKELRTIFVRRVWPLSATCCSLEVKITDNNVPWIFGVVFVLRKIVRIVLSLCSWCVGMDLEPCKHALTRLRVQAS